MPLGFEKTDFGVRMIRFREGIKRREDERFGRIRFPIFWIFLLILNQKEVLSKAIKL